MDKSLENRDVNKHDELEILLSEKQGCSFEEMIADEEWLDKVLEIEKKKSVESIPTDENFSGKWASDENKLDKYYEMYHEMLKIIDEFSQVKPAKGFGTDYLVDAWEIGKAYLDAVYVLEEFGEDDSVTEEEFVKTIQESYNKICTHVEYWGIYPKHGV